MNVSETVAYEGAWLRLKNVVYRGPDGKDHVRTPPLRLVW